MDALKGKEGVFAVLTTEKGEIVLNLFYKETPMTVTNFVGLAEGTLKAANGKPFYDGLKFHRVIANFMIQGGDPRGNGTGGPGYKFPDEFVDELIFDKPGKLAMANSGANTNGSQFFITHVPTDWLNHKHTIFGEVVTGQEVVDTVVNGIKELTPANFPTTTATGVAVEPEVVAMKDITTAFAHKYIVLEDEATFVSKANMIAPIVVTIADKEYTMPDRFTKFVNNWKPVAGDMFKVTAIVGFDANGNVELYPTAMEKVEKPEVKATWSIEEGATIESLGNISVTFDGVEKAATTQTVPVCFYAVDENNVETPVTGLATAGAISASSTNATITFDASSYGNLAEGKYCIRLAVGDVYFNGDKANVSTEEYVLTFNYVLPVEPTFTVSPENHSIVKEFKEIVITYPELEMIGVKSFVGEPDITWPFFNQTLVNENGEVIAEQAMAPMVCEQVAANAVKISLSINYGFASIATAGTYSVTIPAGLIIFPTNQSNRAFTLYYTVDSNPTDVDNATLSTIFVQDGRIVAEGEYQIYTITGQNVTGMNGSLENGVYVVKSANAAVKVVVK